MGNEEDKRNQDDPRETTEHMNGNGTGAEWTAEGTARMNGYVDEFYRANELVNADSSPDGGREMDDLSRKQLSERQEVTNDFLNRQETKREEKMESSAEYPNNDQNDSMEADETTFKEKVFHTMAAGMMVAGLSQEIANVVEPVSVDSPRYESGTEVSINVGDHFNQKTPFDEYASKFKDVNGISLFDAAAEIADDLKKRAEEKVETKSLTNSFSDSKGFQNPDGVDPNLLDDPEFRLEEVDNTSDLKEGDPEKTSRLM